MHDGVGRTDSFRPPAQIVWSVSVDKGRHQTNTPRLVFVNRSSAARQTGTIWRLVPVYLFNCCEIDPPHADNLKSPELVIVNRRPYAGFPSTDPGQEGDGIGIWPTKDSKSSPYVIPYLSLNTTPPGSCAHMLAVPPIIVRNTPSRLSK